MLVGQLGPISTTVGSIAPLTTERYRICELFAELLHCSNMALLNRPAEYSKLYDAEGRLQGGLAAMEELAQVLAMKTGEQRDADVMDESEDELEPAEELPVSSERNHSIIDSDEDMSSGGNSDEDMDDIAIDEPLGSPARTPEAHTPDALSNNPILSPSPSAPPRSPSVSPSPERIRRISSDPTRSPVSRPRSSHSRRSLRRSSRRDSGILSDDLPAGERLKKKFLETSLLADILVRQIS
jgi:serine/threonine-protein phosphatase 6 regulatory subunit 3